jgi:hypothetical protein
LTKHRVDINRDSVRYLEIEYDLKHTGGYYLFIHTEDDGGFDNWFETFDEATGHAEQLYGVRTTDWSEVR